MILKKETVLKLKLDPKEIQENYKFYIYKDPYQFETYNTHDTPTWIISTDNRVFNYTEFLEQLSKSLGYTKYNNVWLDIRWSCNFTNSNIENLNIENLSIENFVTSDIESIILNLVIDVERFNNWVIVIGGSEYYSDLYSNNICNNINDAFIFKNITKEKVQKIANEKFPGLRCPVYAIKYNEAKEEYEKRIYVDPETKKYKWGKCINLIEAIKLNQSGRETIGYKYNNDIRIFNKNELPVELPIDLILNAKWSIIEKNI